MMKFSKHVLCRGERTMCNELIYTPFYQQYLQRHIIKLKTYYSQFSFLYENFTFPLSLEGTLNDLFCLLLNDELKMHKIRNSKSIYTKFNSPQIHTKTT